MAVKKEYTPEEIAAYNQRKQAEMEEMIKRIDEGVKSVFESDKYKEYLKFVSKFTDYSARNTMLINQQKPEATLVASYGKWQKLGRYVEKGETGIEILAPVKFKSDKVLEIERPALDEFGNQLYNPDGTEKMETVEAPVTDLSFKKAYVFDVSQTGGKDIPEFITELSGDIDSARKEAVIAALKKVTKADFKFKDIQGGSKGYYNASKNFIVIKSGMSDAQTLKTAFHEAAHDLLHDPEKNIVTVKSPRNEKEVQAESVAFIVAEKFGMDTSEYSFPYIASWSDGKQLDQLKNALQEIQSAAKAISDEIESELLKLQKRNLSMEEKLADEELNNIQKAEFLIEDCSDRGVNFSAEDTDKILDFAGEHDDIYETVQFVSDMETIQRQRDSYGYDFTNMTPIDTKEAALEAFDRGEAVYLLYPDNTEGQALDRSDIEGFDGYFGIEKQPTADLAAEQSKNLIPVSKEVALEMWDKDLDVFIDGVMAENREDIENAPDTAKMYLSEYQYTAQLEFENQKVENVTQDKEYIGNTPYQELGDKSELQYYSKLRNRHAENIAEQLNADGVKFSGVKEKWTTTITINKADIPKYEEAVKKVIAGYEQSRAAGILQGDSEAPANDPVIGNTPYTELGDKSELQYYRNLNNNHAENIAKQLDADGIKFSGMKKGFATTITINKADIPAYEAAVEKVKAGYDQNKTARISPSENLVEQDKAGATQSNIIGNTPYAELGDKSELQYYRNLKNRHAENVVKQLDADGIKFSGVKKGTVTTITINKADISKYEAAVEKVKAMYNRNKDNPITPSKKPADIAKAIYNAISESNYELYRYHLDKAAASVIKEYGAEQVSKVLAEYIANHDFDGRISRENKEWAKGIDFPQRQYGPVLKTHPAVLDGFINETRSQIKALELTPETKLPSIYDDKFLYSIERVELRDDHRGIPETHHYMSSVNEYFVEGSGWLDNAAYDQELKNSKLSPKDFYEKVTRINASYVDSQGKTGQIDVSKAEYDMLSEKTYSNENEAALKAAKAKLEERKAEAGVIGKPIEYYAVRQTSDRKFEISSMNAEGTISTVKSNIPTVSEAKKAMVEIYESKKDSVRCEFVHPQTLDEIHVEIAKNRSAKEQSLPETAPKEPDKPKTPDFEIYQLKRGMENHYIRFETLEELAARGEKPDFSRYEKIYEGNESMLDLHSGKKTLDKLEAIFEKFNIARPDDFMGHSLSISDVVVMNDKAYYVDEIGFQPLKEFKPIEKSPEIEKVAANPEKEKPKPQKKPKL